MSDLSQTSTAILLITVWREPGTPVLRARITSTTDARVQGTTVTLSGREAVLAYVQEWLEGCEGQLELRKRLG